MGSEMCIRDRCICTCILVRVRVRVYVSVFVNVSARVGHSVTDLETHIPPNTYPSNINHSARPVVHPSSPPSPRYLIYLFIYLLFICWSQIHAIYHDPSGEVEVRFPTSRPSATSEGGPCRGNTLDISFTPCTARVTPVGQAALNIAIQRRLERMVAEVGAPLKTGGPGVGWTFGGWGGYGGVGCVCVGEGGLGG